MGPTKPCADVGRLLRRLAPFLDHDGQLSAELPRSCTIGSVGQSSWAAAGASSSREVNSLWGGEAAGAGGTSRAQALGLRPRARARPGIWARRIWCVSER